jgi:hypothetical protein
VKTQLKVRSLRINDWQDFCSYDCSYENIMKSNMEADVNHDTFVGTIHDRFGTIDLEASTQ